MDGAPGCSRSNAWADQWCALQLKLNNQILAEEKHVPMYKVRIKLKVTSAVPAGQCSKVMQYLAGAC